MNSKNKNTLQKIIVYAIIVIVLIVLAIVEFLKAQNITRIDYLIGTHIDEDHIGGLYKVIDELDIGQFICQEV